MPGLRLNASMVNDVLHGIIWLLGFLRGPDRTPSTSENSITMHRTDQIIEATLVASQKANNSYPASAGSQGHGRSQRSVVTQNFVAPFVAAHAKERVVFPYIPHEIVNSTFTI